MDIVVTQIKQIGREIILDGNSLIGYQHSANLFIKLVKDTSESNPFKGMTLSGYCSSWKTNTPVICPLQEKEDGTYILLPDGVFEQGGDVYLSLGAVNDQRVVITSNNMVLQVDDSNNIVTATSPPEKYWEIEVLNAMKVWYAQSVDAPLKEILAQLDTMIATAKQQLEQVTDIIVTAQEQQTNVADVITSANQATNSANSAAHQANTAAQAAMNASNEAISAKNEANAAAASVDEAKSNAEKATTEANTATANANKATADANTAANLANTKAREAETATTAANTAANNANEKADLANTAKEATEAITAEVQRKLDNGEFVGEPGPISTADGEVVKGIATKNDILSTGWGVTNSNFHILHNTNLNDVTKSGVYGIGRNQGVTSVPQGVLDGMLVVLTYKPDYLTQVLYSFSGDTANNVYIRTKYANVFSAWVKQTSESGVTIKDNDTVSPITLQFRVTDTLETPTSNTIKVSPNMGIKTN